MVARVSLLVTAAVAMVLAPATVVMIHVLLPAFIPSLPALFILLPGVVALSATRVVYVYLTGIGKPALTSYITVFAFVLNIVLNVYLIPRFGIEGAATASLVSYTVSAILLTTVAGRLSGRPVLDFWLVRRSDLRFTITMSVGLLQRLLKSSARPA
jgi:O-antigen/teichoic acid export membrane protein